MDGWMDIYTNLHSQRMSIYISSFENSNSPPSPFSPLPISSIITRKRIVRDLTSLRTTASTCFGRCVVGSRVSASQTVRQLVNLYMGHSFVGRR